MSNQQLKTDAFLKSLKKFTDIGKYRISGKGQTAYVELQLRGFDRKFSAFDEPSLRKRIENLNAQGLDTKVEVLALEALHIEQNKPLSDSII
jgi:hypothetical protein